MCSKVSILNPQVFFLASRFMIPHEATLALRRGTRNVLLLRERESRWGGGLFGERAFAAVSVVVERHVIIPGGRENAGY